MTPDEIIKAARELDQREAVAPKAPEPAQLSPDEIISQARALREQEAKPTILERGLTAAAGEVYNKAVGGIPVVGGMLQAGPQQAPVTPAIPQQAQSQAPAGPAPGFFGGMSQLTPGNVYTGFMQGYDQMTGMMDEGTRALNTAASGAPFEYAPDGAPQQPIVDRSQMGWFPKAAYDVASNLAPSIAAPLVERALPTAAVGAGVGGAAGALGLGVGAVPGALAGAGTGATTGMTLGAYEMGVGDILQTMKDAGVDAGDAQMLSLAYSIPYGAMEMLQLGVAGKYALGVLKKSIAGVAAKEITPEIAKSLVARAVKEGGKLAAGTASEIVAEGAQKGITEGATANALYNTGETEKAADVAKGIPAAMLQEMEDVAPSMILTGGAGGSVSLAKGAVRNLTPMDPLKVSRDEWVAAGNDPLDHEKAVTEAMESGDKARQRKVSAAALQSHIRALDRPKPGIEMPTPATEAAPETQTEPPAHEEPPAPPAPSGPRTPSPEEFLESGGNPDDLTASGFDALYPEGWTQNADPDTIEFFHAIQTTRDQWVAQGGDPDAHRRQVMRAIELDAPVSDEVAAPYYTEDADFETEPEAPPVPVEEAAPPAEEELPGMSEVPAPAEPELETPDAPDPVEDVAVPDTTADPGAEAVVEGPPAGMPETLGEVPAEGDSQAKELTWQEEDAIALQNAQTEDAKNQEWIKTDIGMERLRLAEAVVREDEERTFLGRMSKKALRENREWVERKLEEIRTAPLEGIAAARAEFLALGKYEDPRMPPLPDAEAPAPVGEPIVSNPPESETQVESLPTGETQLAPPAAPQSMVDEFQAVMDVGAHPPVYVPTNALTLSKEVPNFKKNADPKTGVVTPLEGNFDDRNVAPVAVWRRKDGSLEVVSGRHRLEHAKKNNRNSILAQVFNEADGFGAEEAAAMDAELNIRDGNGEVTDYGSYFRRAKLSKPEARQRGLLREEKARRGFTIGTVGSDDVFTSWENGALETGPALAIVETAGADNTGQAIGLNLAISRPQLALDVPRFRETLKALLHMRVQGDKTMDMFGTETYDTAIEEAERRAAIAGRRQRDIADKLAIFKAGRVDRGKAASLGIDINVKDEAAVEAERRRLLVEAERWRDWPQHPDLVQQVVAEEQGVGEVNPQVDMTPADVEVSDVEAAAEEAVVPVEKPKKKMSKAKEHSARQAAFAVVEIERLANGSDRQKKSEKTKRRAGKAWETLSLHLNKLGIEVPKRGTFFDIDSDAAKVAQVKGQIPEVELYQPKPPATTESMPDDAKLSAEARIVDVRRDSERIEAAAKKLGYSVKTHTAGTGTRYISLEREDASVVVRVSDHNEVYLPQPGERRILVSPYDMTSQEAISALESPERIPEYDPTEDRQARSESAREQMRADNESEWGRLRSELGARGVWAEMKSEWRAASPQRRKELVVAWSQRESVPWGTLYRALTGGAYPRENVARSIKRMLPEGAERFSAEDESMAASEVAGRDAIRARILIAVKGVARGLGLRVNIQWVTADRSIDGAYRDGTVFLNLDGLIENSRRYGVSPEAYAVGKVIHEGIIHHGFSFLSETSRQHLAAWVEAHVGMEEIIRLIPNHEAYRGLSKEALVEEYIARIAERARTDGALTEMQGGVWRRVVAAIRKALKLKMNTDLAAIASTPAEVNKFVASLILDGGRMDVGQSKSTLRWSVEEDFRNIRFVSVARIARMMGDRPEHLDRVIRRMSYAHARLMNGEMTTPDVIRAYVITTASIQAGAMDRDLLEEKSGFRVDDEFCEVSPSGVVTVRPEDAVAAWLMTERGERAVSNAARGNVDMKDWENLLFIRRQYGNASVMERMFASNLGGSRVTMHNINDLTTRLNDARTDPEKFHAALRDLNGIGFGKAPFIAHLLGLGTEPTVDAVEINAWLTGKGDVRGASERLRSLAAFLKRSGVFEGRTHKAITRRVKELGEIVGQDIDPAIRATLIHHWLWDAVRGTETRHTGMYLAIDGMRFSAEADVGNEEHLNAMPRLPETDAVTPEAHDEWLARLEEWLEGAPPTMAFVDPDEGNSLILVSREAYQEGKWRQTFWHKSGDGWAPGGHITFDTRLDAVRDVSVYGVDYDPHILFSAEAYHGSPHRDIEKTGFSTDKIGTGEGAQAYGWGLYFAGRREVAEYYRKSLSGPRDLDELKEAFGDAWAAVSQYRAGNKKKALGYLDDEIERRKDHWIKYNLTPTQAAKDSLDGLVSIRERMENDTLLPPGQLYEVELAPDDDEYLLWDKPLSEQSEKVRKAFMSSAFYKKMMDEQRRVNEEAGYQYFDRDSMSGETWYHMLEMSSSPQESSALLHSLGIRGIKYLDGTSRSKGEGAFNYVIFNDKDVNVKSVKYSAETPESTPVSDALQTYGTEIDAAAALIRQVDVLLKSKKVPQRQTMSTIYTLVTRIPKNTPGRDKALGDFFRVQREVQTLEAKYKAEANAEQELLYEVDPSAQQGFLFSIEDTSNGRPDNGMASMEMVALAEALIGENNIRVAKSMRNYNGIFRPDTKEITVRSDLFAGDTLTMLLYRKVPTAEQQAELQTQWGFLTGVPASEIVIHYVKRKNGYVVRVIRRNHQAALHTLAHEIGHAEDYAPGPDDDGPTMKRGRILGRIAKLRGYLGTFMGVITADERKALRRQAQRDAREAGFDPKVDKEAFNQAVRQYYGEALAARLQEIGDYNENHVGDIPGIRDELEALTQWWRGITPEQMDDYFRKGEELYADMISVLLNQPDEFRVRCPQTYRALGEFFSRHPEMRDTYVEIQTVINEAIEGNPEELMDRRLERLRRMMVRDEDVRRKVIEDRNSEMPRLTWRRFWNDIVRIIQARDVVLPDAESRMANHDIAYVGGRLKQYHRDVQAQVVKVLDDAGVNLENYGLFLGLRRVAYDEGRQDIANFQGTTDDSAQALLDHMRVTMGDRAFTAMETAAESMADIREHYIFPALEASGLVDAEFLAKLRANRYYSTFEVARYFAEFSGGNGTKILYKQFGSVNDIMNPFYSTMATDAQIMWAAVNNHSKMKTVEGLRREAPGDIYEPKWTVRGGIRTASNDKNPNLYGLLEWREGTQQKAAIVPLAVAKLYEHNPTVAGPASAAFFAATSILKRIMTTNNPAFGLGNVMMDFHRTYMNVPTKGFWDEFLLAPSLVFSYVRSLPDAFRDAFLKQSTPLVREMYEKGLLVPGRTFSARKETGIEAYERIQKEWDLDVSKQENFLWRFGRWIFDDFNQSLERLSKIAGYRMLRDSGMSDMDLKRTIRAEIGSPDFMQAGTATPYTNSIFLFSNAGVQSLAALGGVAKRRPVTLGIRIALSVVVPKMIMAYFASGDDGDDDDGLEELARRYGMIPDRDKAHRLSFPAPWTESGYLSLPMDRTLDPIGAAVWAAMGSENPNAWGEVKRAGLGVLLPFGMDSLNSYIDVARAAYDAGMGINPYDYFRGVPIVDQTTWEAGGFESAKELGKWAYNEIVGSKVGVEFERPYSVRQSRSSSVPILSPFIRRFYRDSDFGIQEQEMFREKAKEQADARKRMPVKQFIADTVRDMEERDDMSPSEIWGAAKKAGAVPEGYKYSQFRGMLTSTLNRRFGEK